MDPAWCIAQFRRRYRACYQQLGVIGKAAMQQFRAMRLAAICRRRRYGSNKTAPFASQRQSHMRGAEVRIAIRKSSLAFSWQVKILYPLMPTEELTIIGTKMQGRPAEMPHADMLLIAIDREAFGWAAFVMMAAVIYQQIDAQIYGTFHAMHQTPGDTGRMLVPFHPDALLHDEVTDGKTPDREAAVQPERFKMDKSSWLNRTAAPAIGKQGPAALIVMQRGISFGEDEQAFQRGLRRSDKQTVITACQALGNRAASISAQAIRQPPFASAGLFQIATGCATEADSVRRLFGYCQCAVWTIIDRSL